MLVDTLTLVDGSSVSNLVLPVGTADPSLPDTGELFFRTDLGALRVYNSSAWVSVGNSSLFTSSVAGLVPGSGGGTTNFLRADGTWVAPTAVFNGGTITSALTISAALPQLILGNTTNNARITSAVSAAGAGLTLQLLGANATTSGQNGGIVSMIGGSGSGTATGGDVTLTGGNSGSTAGTGGGVTIVAGLGAGGTAAGGAVTIAGGNGSTSGAGGSIILNAGQSTSGNGGHVWLEAGDSTSGTKGSVVLRSASLERLRVLPSGAWSVGPDGNNYGTSGYVLTSNGNAAPTWQAAAGGGGSLTATYIGYGNGSNQLTGEADLTWNATTNLMTVGSLATGGIVAGSDNASGTGGSLTVRGGDSTSGGVGNHIFIRGGNGTAGTGGHVNITGGTSSNQPGNIVLTTSKASGNTSVGSMYIDMAQSTAGNSRVVLRGSSQGYEALQIVTSTQSGGIADYNQGGSVGGTGYTSMLIQSGTQHGGGGPLTLELAGYDSLGSLAGGNVQIRGGFAQNGGSSFAGNVLIQGGRPGTIATNGGYVAIQTVPAGSVTLTERLRILASGAWSVGSNGTSYGSSGQVLTSNGNAAPTWQAASATSLTSSNISITATASQGTINLTTTGGIPGVITIQAGSGSGNYDLGGLTNIGQVVLAGTAAGSSGSYSGVGQFGNILLTAGSITGGTYGSNATRAGDVIISSGVTTVTGSGGPNTLPGYISLRTGAATLTERLRILGNGAWSVGINGTATGTNGQVLTSVGSGGPPTWQSPAASGVSSITGTANQITASASTGAVTLSIPTTLNIGTASTGPTLAAVTGTSAGTAFAINGSTATSGAGGSLSIRSGNATGTGVGGTMSITAGTSANAAGGVTNISSGAGTGSNNGGQLNITAGAAPGAGTGGAVVISGGTSSSGTAGAVRILTNSTERLDIRADGAWEVAGDVGTATYVLTSNGAGTSPTWQAVAGGGGFNGGTITTAMSIEAEGPQIILGDASNAAWIRSTNNGAGAGQRLSLTGANSAAPSQVGGEVMITGGAGGSGAIGGAVSMQGGNTSAASTYDSVWLMGAVNTGSGPGGSIAINSGSSTTGGGGDIYFTTGAASYVQNERLRIVTTGAWSVGANGTDFGTSGFQLTTNGSGGPPTWQAAASDSRLKTNVAAIPVGLDYINGLTPVEYNWVGDRHDGKLHYGLIAQDVPVAGGIVCEGPVYLDGDLIEDAKQLQYNEITAVLIKAVQELSQKLDAKDTEIADLLARVAALEA